MFILSHIITVWSYFLKREILSAKPQTKVHNQQMLDKHSLNKLCEFERESSSVRLGNELHFIFYVLTMSLAYKHYV